MAKKPAAKRQTGIQKIQSPGKKLIAKPWFGRWYAIAAVMLLLLSAIAWSVLGATAQQDNADQLINPYLFESSDTFNQALIPSQHSFLVKWPVFYLIKLLGFSSAAYLWTTVSLVLLTLAVLIYVLWRIERRPVVFGTLCLAIASMLVLVPAQPYSGALLPVNLAMVATRNIEYALYVIALVLLARSPKLRHRNIVGATLLLTVLAASDKLFVSLSFGGAVLMLIAYGLRRRTAYMHVAIHWLVASVVSAIGASLVLWILGATKLTQVVGATNTPYSIGLHAKELALGILYAVASVFTNYGANPAFDATRVHDIPHATFSRLTSLGGVTYLVNIILLLTVVFAVYRLVMYSFGKQSAARNSIHAPHALSLMLICTSIAAVGAFIVSNHYYAVDARYLAIVFFAGVICLATFLSGKHLPREHVVFAGAVLAIVAYIGLFASFKTFQTQTDALANIHDRNTTISQTLASRNVDILVGDYWRVVPIKAHSQKPIAIMPLQDCTTPRVVLSSRAWEHDLTKTSFAYVWSLDKSLTDFPSCSADSVTERYGEPNASTLIDGTYEKPKEMLLFYDKGAKSSTPKQAPESTNTHMFPSTILPIPLSELPGTRCSTTSIMNIVAHEDDDLLFMNPDTLQDIQEGNCVRSIYVTAGDAGQDRSYWSGREQGVKAAYAHMLGPGTLWVEYTVKMPGGTYITVAMPRGNPQIALIFMHLPDGNIRGDGFAATNHVSLTKLYAGELPELRTVDKQSSYTKDNLVATLTQLLQAYRPDVVRTQSTEQGKNFTDHSDHIAVGKFVELAQTNNVTSQSPASHLVRYTGYPIRSQAENIAGGLLSAKESAFFAYAQHDNSVCRDALDCARTATYGSYLRRQYQTIL